jgi:hypothetical protein
VTWAFSVISPRCHHDQSQTHGISLARSTEATVRAPAFQKYLAGTASSPSPRHMVGDCRLATYRVAVNCRLRRESGSGLRAAMNPACRVLDAKSGYILRGPRSGDCPGDERQHEPGDDDRHPRIVQPVPALLLLAPVGWVVVGCPRSGAAVDRDEQGDPHNDAYGAAVAAATAAPPSGSDRGPPKRTRTTGTSPTAHRCAPDNVRLSETSPDIRAPLNCGNQTQRDALRLNRMQTTKPTVLHTLSYALHLRQCSGFLYLRRVFARRSEPAAYVWLKDLLRIEKAEHASWQRKDAGETLAGLGAQDS